MPQWSIRHTYPSIISLQQPLIPHGHALNSEHALIQHSNPYKVSCLRLFSDLMKCSVEHETQSLFNQASSVKEKITFNF